MLSESERSFFVPRASQGDFGFGQSNVWFAKDETAAGYVKRVLEYIADQTRAVIPIEETIPQEIPDEYKESGIGKKVFVNKYERNTIARKKCLEVHGTSCMICGFNAATVYGDDFEGKIEVHHIVPINEIDAEYNIDPVQDLIPVCPNCHTMLHTKMRCGDYPTVEMLKTLISKK